MRKYTDIFRKKKDNILYAALLFYAMGAVLRVFGPKVTLIHTLCLMFFISSILLTGIWAGKRRQAKKRDLQPEEKNQP
jgi:hypothetical protein